MNQRHHVGNRTVMCSAHWMGNKLACPLRWLQTNTFIPRWMPQRGQLPPVGYSAALLLQLTLGMVSVLILYAFPAYTFFGVMQLLGVLVIALVWGVGPSLLATLTGTAIIALFHKEELILGSIGFVADLLGLGIFLVVGCAMSVLVSQVVHAQQAAEAAQQDAEHLARSLQREKARLEAVIDAVPDALTIRAVDGTYIQMNQAAREATDSSVPCLPIDDPLPRWTLDADQVPERDVPLAAAAQGERIHRMEYTNARADGQQQHLAVSMAPIVSTDGAVEEVVVISHDITGLKQAQQAEAQRANEFAVLFDSLVDGVIVMAPDEHIVQANAAFRHLSSDPHLMAWSFRERMAHFAIRNDQGAVIPLEHLPGARILRGEVLQGPTAVDVQIHSPTQGVRYHNTTGAPIRDAAGNITGGVLVLRDVTERRQWEQRIRTALGALVAIAAEVVRIPIEQEVNAEHAARRLADLISQVLRCRRVIMVTVNPVNDQMSLAAMTGFTPEEAVHMQTHIAGSTPGKHFSGKQLARLRRGDVIFNVKSSSTQAGFAFLSPQALVTPMLVEGHLIGVVGLDFGTPGTFSTTEQMLVAATIPKLAALVLERERLVHQHAGTQVRILALQQAKERMDLFLNMASHELRTPLTSIIGYTHLVRKRLARLHGTIAGEPEGQFAHLIALLDDADTQATYLNRLIGDLLEASRAEGRKFSLQSAVWDITDVVHEAIQAQQVANPHRHIILHQAETTPLLVEMDRGRILQVVTNYLTNALKYSPPDRPVTAGVREEREQVSVSVADQGPGIPPGEHERIWERFYRMESLTAQNAVIPGLGMGLYLSRAIIEQHGGQVGVDSQVGAGSTFWFTLPRYHEGTHP